jgi:ATP-dependent Lon protease
MSPLAPLFDASTLAKADTPPDQGQARVVLATPGDLPDDALVIVPVRNLVMFPGMIVPISIGRESSIKAAQYAVKAERPVGILMQRNPEVEAPGLDDLAAMGTVAVILRYVTSQDGSHHIICQGQQRFRVLGYLDGFDFTVARVERLLDTGAGPSDEDKREIEARYLQLKARALEVLQLLPNVPQEMLQAVQDVESPGMLADLVAGYVDIKPAEKQELLEEVDLRRRLDRVIDMLVHRIEVLNLSRDIDKRTKASIGEREREFLLREQLKTIQKKLGEGEADNTAELAELHKLIDAAQMPEDVAKQANKELKRLTRMSDSSAEYSMVRTYLDWLVELPWQAPEPDDIDVAKARQVLDADHFGLDQVKKRVLEFLAVRKLKPGGHGPILCLVGPPGVG